MTLKKSPTGVSSGGGTTVYIFLNGNPVNFMRVTGPNVVGATNTFHLTDVRIGDLIDFALSPEGAAGDGGDGSDTSSTAIQIHSHQADALSWNARGLSENPTPSAPFVIRIQD